MPWADDRVNSQWWEFVEQQATAQNADGNADAITGSVIAIVQGIYNDIDDDEILAYRARKDDLSVVDMAGDADETIDGQPKKNAVLLQDADNMELWIAFAELIDNILDNHKQCAEMLMDIRGDSNLSVTIQCFDIVNGAQPLEFGNGTITIKENSGGVKPEPKSKSFLTTPGSSEWSAGSVGLWGRGGKLALAALGRFNTFSSHYPNGHFTPTPGITIINPFLLQFGAQHDSDGVEVQDTEPHKSKMRNYYHPENTYWKVPGRRVTGGYVYDNPGSSFIKIEKLTQRAIDFLSDPEKVTKMVDRLAKVFRLKIVESQRVLGCEISIKLEVVSLDLSFELSSVEISEVEKYEWDPDDLANLFTHVPGFEPIRRKFVIPVDADKKLVMDTIVGHTMNHNDRLGWYMWGHDRLFHESYKDFKSTPGGGNMSYKSTHAQTGRVLGFVRFSAENDNSLIPWNGPDKWGFLETHPLKEKIKKILGRCTQHYVNLGAHTFGEKNQQFLTLFDI